MGTVNCCYFSLKRLHRLIPYSVTAMLMFFPIQCTGIFQYDNHRIPVSIYFLYYFFLNQFHFFDLHIGRGILSNWVISSRYQGANFCTAVEEVLMNISKKMQEQSSLEIVLRVQFRLQ